MQDKELGVNDPTTTKLRVGVNPMQNSQFKTRIDVRSDQHTKLGGLLETISFFHQWPSITPNPGNKSDHRQKSNWYDVPYKIMVPKQGQGINLLVPVALSSSAVAFSSTRIENMYMSVGTAAGIAAYQV